MRFLAKLKQAKSNPPTISGFWYFTEEMDRLGLWPQMTEARASRSLEYAGVPAGGPDATIRAKSSSDPGSQDALGHEFFEGEQANT